MTPAAQRFAADGYAVYPDAVPDPLLHALERSLTDLYVMQARKLGGDPDGIDDAVTWLEEHDPEAGYQVLPLAAQSHGGRLWAAWDGWAQFAAELMDIPPVTLLVTPPSPFVNLPRSGRLLYRWHVEAHYYPKRRRFLNVWVPLFHPKTAANGAMRIVTGSHRLGDLPFIESRPAGAFVQYEIPEALIADGDTRTVEANPGTVVVFDRRAVHCSTVNTSTVPSYAAVCRLWDPSTDYTLSGDIAATPYGGDYARPGLVA